MGVRINCNTSTAHSETGALHIDGLSVALPYRLVARKEGELRILFDLSDDSRALLIALIEQAGIPETRYAS
jgi:hypothetical protein